MDPSLAKGIKNQLFRELSDEIDEMRRQWRKYIKDSKLGSSRTNWDKFCQGVGGPLGPFLLAKYHGGSKKHPLLCLATFEGGERQYNSWNENCISSNFFYAGHNPLWVDSMPVGFSISEHAIQRIFERSYTDGAPLRTDFRKINFTNELRHAPLWSFFWFINGNERLKNTDISSFPIIIPSESGLLLGEVPNFNLRNNDSLRCEIRTFIAQPQLNPRQLELMQVMTEISEKYTDSVVPFLANPYVNQQPIYQPQFHEFFLKTQDLKELLRAEHDISI